MNEIPPDWYSAWVAHHRDAFMLPQEWIRAAVIFWPIFGAMAVSQAELRDATRELIGGKRPEPWDQLSEVRAAVGRARNHSVAKMLAEREAAAGACPHCGSTGWVLVPHPDFCQGGFWEPARNHYRTGEPVYLKATVTCRCHRGMRTLEAFRAKASREIPMTLDYFEANVCPTWGEQMAKVDRETEERAGIVRRADAALGDVRNMIAGLAGRDAR